MEADTAVTLTVYGAGFDGSSVVNWDGAALPTTLLDSLTLQAEVEATLVGFPRQVSVTVPGSGLAPATVRVVSDIQELYLPLVNAP
jgi:hypothetical protein